MDVGSDDSASVGIWLGSPVGTSEVVELGSSDGSVLTLGGFDLCNDGVELGSSEGIELGAGDGAPLG